MESKRNAVGCCSLPRRQRHTKPTVGDPPTHAHIPTLYSNPPTQTHACERRHSDPRLGDTHVRNEEQFSDLRNGRVLWLGGGIEAV